MGTGLGFKEFIYYQIASSRKTNLMTGIITAGTGVILLILWWLPSQESRALGESFAGTILLGSLIIIGAWWIRKGLSSQGKNLFYQALFEHPDQVVWLHKQMENTFAGQSYYIHIYLINGRSTSFWCASKEEMETLYQSALRLYPLAISEYREGWLSLYQEDARFFTSRVKVA